MRRRLDVHDIQGHVLRPFKFDKGSHRFVRIEDAAAGRSWLRELVENFVSDTTRESKPSPFAGVNVAFSAAGLAALGVPTPWLAGFSEEFRKGMAARADVLGDRGLSDPGTWRTGFGASPPPLAMVSAYGDEVSLAELLERLDEASDRPGLGHLEPKAVGRLKDGREHFDFADGFAQPEIEGAPSSPRAASRGKPLPAGEFLLGHRDVEYAVAPGPAAPLGRNGTYLVYRELAQDVAGFRHYVRAQAADKGLTPDHVAAKMVGRWPDGSPLVLSPDEPDPSLTRGDEFDPRINNFSYRDDLEGMRCPLGAHIRRVNPRDALAFGNRFRDRLSRRHRMVRRGMPYGEPLPPDQLEDDGIERGLAFICFVASIQRQFEFVQAQWCNDGNAFGLGLERDALVGQGVEAGDGTPTKMTIPGERPCFLSPLPQIVHTRAGEYFFLPSLTALRWLSDSGWS